MHAAVGLPTDSRAHLRAPEPGAAEGVEGHHARLAVALSVDVDVLSISHGGTPEGAQGLLLPFRRGGRWVLPHQLQQQSVEGVEDAVWAAKVDDVVLQEQGARGGLLAAATPRAAVLKLQGGQGLVQRVQEAGGGDRVQCVALHCTHGGGPVPGDLAGGVEGPACARRRGALLGPGEALCEDTQGW